MSRSRPGRSSSQRKRARSAKRRQLTQRRRSNLEMLEARYLLAFTTDLFADINLFGLSSLPDSFIEFNNEAYFVANDGLTGSELWKTDGTETGTVQVADINPGAAGSLPEQLTVFGNDLFFTAIDDDDEFDIWKTDGVSGVTKVFDADPAGVYDLKQFTASGTKLFFTAYELSTGYELWATDGTSAGTALVLDINSDQSVFEPPRELTDVNGKLFFSAYSNGYDNRELWESDGTAAGTVMVADIDGDPLESSDPRNLTAVGNVLFFAAETPTTGEELFSSTGTTGSTGIVSDLLPGIGSSDPQNFASFNNELYFSAIDATGRQLFRSDGASINLVANTTASGTDPSSPTELTVAGSNLFFIAEGGIVPGPVVAMEPTLTTQNSFRSSSSNYAGIVINTTSLNGGQLRTATSSPLTFSSTSGGNGAIGTTNVGLSNIEVGDFILRDVDTGDLASDQWEWSVSDPAGLTDIDFSGFASANAFNDATEGLLFELFLNGSPTRTSFVEISGADLDDFNAGRTPDNLSLTHPGGASVTSATVRMTFGLDGGAAVQPEASDEQIVIRASLGAIGATSGTAGRELHVTDGTTTSLVKDIVQASASSQPSQLTAVGNQLFFTADDPVNSGRELWTSDGTESGTALVQDIRTGFDNYGSPLSGEPEQLTAIGNQLYFSVVDDLNDREVWTSGGTAATTAQLKNINTGSQDANIQQVVEVAGKLFFVADDGVNGEAVWVADPVAGTAVIAADVTASSEDRINGLAAFGTGVIFHNDSLGVYTTDGTITTAITSNTPVDFDGNGSLFVAAGPNAYFVFDDGTNGEELWRTDGTAVGTMLAADVSVGAASSTPRNLVEFNGDVYFSAHAQNPSSDSGRELIVYNGSTATIVRDINTDNPGGPITESSDPQDLVVSGGRIFFTADGGVNNGNAGRELWSSDGTFTGTTLAMDIRAGATGSDPINLTDVNGVLYFAANDGSTGYEPYRSDGTTTTSLGNINPGSANSDPDGFVQAGTAVYFAATETATGRELYVSDVTAGGATLVADQQTGAGSSNPLPLGTVSADRLVVALTESGVDREIWMVGGAVTTLTQAIDMNPGEFFGSDPTDLVQVGGKFLFVGDDGVSGREIYELEEIIPEADWTTVLSQMPADHSYITSFRVHFNSIVDVELDAFTFVNETLGKTLVDIPVIGELDGKTIVDFTFTPDNTDPVSTVNVNGVLRDGEYVLTIDGTKISSLGTPIAGDLVYGGSAQLTDNFFRRFADSNGNRLVDFSDLLGFRSSFGKSLGEEGYLPAFDDAGDGAVDFSDLLAFRSQFGT